MSKTIDKINKLTLPATILIASIILGGFYYASQVNKQKSIERQQEIKLQEDKRIEEARAERERMENEAKTEQTQKEYIFKRKKDCYEWELSERKKYNNVVDSFYKQYDYMEGKTDVCVVVYKSDDYNKEVCDEQLPLMRKRYNDAPEFLNLGFLQQLKFLQELIPECNETFTNEF